MTALPGKKDYSNVYRLIFAWFFIFTSVYFSLVCAKSFNIFERPSSVKSISANDVREKLKKAGYPDGVIDDYIKSRGFK